MKTIKKSSRQTGTSKLKADKKRKALPPGKRISKNGNVYYEYRKNRSDVKGRDTPSKTKKTTNSKKENKDFISRNEIISFFKNKKIQKNTKENKDLNNMKLGDYTIKYKGNIYTINKYGKLGIKNNNLKSNFEPFYDSKEYTRMEKENPKLVTLAGKKKSGKIANIFEDVLEDKFIKETPATPSYMRIR